MSMLSCYDFIFYLSVLLFGAEIRVARDCLGIKMSQNTEVRGYIQNDKWPKIWIDTNPLHGHYLRARLASYAVKEVEFELLHPATRKTKSAN